jgi:hypothetical protein
MVSGTVYHNYIWCYLGQSISATFDGIWDSLSQLRLKLSGRVSHLHMMESGQPNTATINGIWDSITVTFDGSWGSQSQLRLMLSGTSISHISFMESGTAYHSYVWWYLGQSITATFDGIWDSITATFDGIWDSLSQIRLVVSGTASHLLEKGSGTVYQSYVWWYLGWYPRYVWC